MGHETRAVATREHGGAIAKEGPGNNPWGSVGLLKPYEAGAVASRPRIDALATISAGFRHKEGYPVVSRDGTIHVSPPAGQAPGLEAALAARGSKALTIALVHNDPSEVIQQRFAKYSTTRVEAQSNAAGDAITLINLKKTDRKTRKGDPIFESERETIHRDEDPARFAQLAADMKVQTAMYFALAEWTDTSPPKPRLIFPDGLGLYRLRFTSLNSAEAIKGALYHIASINGGQVAGVPLELSIVYQDVAGPDGSRRNVPIWSLRLNPPETIKLEPQSLRGILTAGTEQARMLSIAAPQPESLEYAEWEGPDVDLDDARIIDGEARTLTQRDVERVAGGGSIRNPQLFIKGFMTSGGPLMRDDENRRNFMLWATGGRYDSLSTFAESATHDQGRGLMEALAQWSREAAEARQEAQERGEEVAPRPIVEKPRRSYAELFPEGDEDAPKPASEQPKAPSASTPEVHNAAVLTGAPSIDPPRPEPDKAYTRAQWDAMYVAWAPILQRLDSAFKPVPTEQLSNGSLKSAVLEILGQVDNNRAILASYDEDEDDAPEEDGETPEDEPAGVGGEAEEVAF